MTEFRFDISDLATLVRDRLPFKWTWISGVEVTQSIQHYQSAQHLTDPADRRADNAVRLVANKPAWVRVYAQSLAERSVTASLTIERRFFGFLWFSVATLTPTGTGVLSASVTESYTQERSSTAETLNFVIPAAHFHGTLRLTVRLRHATSGSEYDSHTLVVNAALRQTLRLRAILVSYNGPSTSVASTPPPPTITLAAPTLANAQATAARALLMMPVQSTGWFTSAGTVAWNLPLDDPRTGAGGCSNNWNALLTRLTTQRTNDGNRGDVVYYGLLPSAIPLGVPGCGVGGLGAGISGDQGTFVHEIGHGYGFQHTPCGNTGASDPNYPTYEPYPSASIGEYGLNISNGMVLSPATISDSCPTVSPSGCRSTSTTGSSTTRASLPSSWGTSHHGWTSSSSVSTPSSVTFPTAGPLGADRDAVQPRDRHQRHCAFGPRGRRRQCGPCRRHGRAAGRGHGPDGGAHRRRRASDREWGTDAAADPWGLRLWPRRRRLAVPLRLRGLCGHGGTRRPAPDLQS
jgi:hypothetical protein